MSGPPVVTPPMTAQRAREIAGAFDLRALPPGFYANPFPVYAHLREHDPVRRMPDGSWLLTRLPTSCRSTAMRTRSAPTRRWSSHPSTARARPCSNITRAASCSTIRRCTRVRKLMMGALRLTQHPVRGGRARFRGFVHAPFAPE